MSWFRRKPKEAPPARHGGLELSRPWARPGLGAPPQAAGFVTIANRGPGADRLVAATSPLAGAVEIHGIKVVGPDIQMRPLAGGLAIEAGDTKTLKPRGYHLLFRDLKAPLATGARLPVVLAFEKAGAIAVELAVEAPGPIGEAILDEDRHRR